MTKSPLSAAGPDTRIVDAIRASSLYASQLTVAASMAIAAFNWLREHRRRYVPLLDFDVISGALPRLALHERGNSDHAYSESALLGDHSGSATLQYLLQNMQELVVPPGTTAEIMFRHQKLTDSLSTRAEQFLRRLHESVNHPASIDSLVKGTEHVDILLDCLRDITVEHQDRALLGAILQRSRSSQEGPESISEDKSTLKVLNTCHQYLMRERPDRPQNNYHDALNAAYVASMFNNSRELMPLLISQTRAVLNLQSESVRHLTSIDAAAHMPLIFADKTFLIVTQGILQRTEQRYGPALDEAKLLDQDASQLRDSCETILQHCRDKIGIPRHEITVRSLPEADWAMLLHCRDQFERRWASIFAPAQMVNQRDRQQYLDLLGSKDWAKELKVSDRDTFNRRLWQFYKKLEATRPADYAIWNLIMNRKGLDAGTRNSAVSALFQVILRDNDGSLLRNIAGGLPMAELNVQILRDTHNVQLAAIPRFVSCGAILTICSFKDMEVSVRRYLRFTWLHICNREQIADICLGLLRATCEEVDRRPVISTLFFPSTSKAVEESDTEVKKLIARSANLETVQFVASYARSFADIVPLEGQELQMGVTVAVDMLSEELLETIAGFIAESSEVPIDRTYVSMLVQECLALLGPMEDERGRLQ